MVSLGSKEGCPNKSILGEETLLAKENQLQLSESTTLPHLSFGSASSQTDCNMSNTVETLHPSQNTHDVLARSWESLLFILSFMLPVEIRPRLLALVLRPVALVDHHVKCFYIDG
ncbi:hypothetical protein PR202_gb11617 [Eleusine coracana subsp. coracana]|uniref:Uncharacterized protein n=1 Tax=Eleusine coracana subsp. coracana TaxID=191504 RepID=A0AAV5EKQ0_ELECO|nr:hypothetical protein PR202_gb11617 [Eleusine coracana subsp. coracana]